MSRHFGYYDDWRTALLRCERCGWMGTFEEGCVEHFAELMDSSCPVCDIQSAPMLAIVSYPTDAEMQTHPAKPGTPENHAFTQRQRFLEAFEASCLKSTEQLPELAGPSITLTWDYLEEGGDHFTVIKHAEKEIWREVACYGGAMRFEAVFDILRQKYASRLADVIPTPSSLTYLYGDDVRAAIFVAVVRAPIHPGPKGGINAKRNR